MTFILAALLICTVPACSVLDQSAGEVPVLKDHPNAIWGGAQDGGIFFEITKKKPPTYYVEVRSEAGSLWIEGWVRYDGRNGAELATQDLWGYDGGEDVYLRDGSKLRLDSSSSK
ncbi:hypothetical protein ABE473_01485 [Stenotrophomonas sp. TWI700]|uniref:hypothetical protein n=1 Tax=Stenotrophomonas sp. TWI700 TaxID=3136792 RepID=UPI003209F1E9